MKIPSLYFIQNLIAKHRGLVNPGMLRILQAQKPIKKYHRLLRMQSSKNGSKSFSQKVTKTN